MASAAARLPDGAIRAQEERARDFTDDDINSLLPDRSPTMAVIENFFRGQFEACLKEANVEANLESCLVFGPDTWADLRSLLLDGGKSGAGQQGFPALERFCREHDIANKQYLLLPLLTARHGSLLVICQPVKGKRATIGWGMQREPLILHLDSGQNADYQHQPDFRSLVSFLTEGKPALVDWTGVPPCLTAYAPLQKTPGSGSLYMCTNALYFAACLPPDIEPEEVRRLKSYPADLKDMFHYPGFLTRLWYPRNVPDALRKTLLRGISDQLRASESTQDTERLLRTAEQVKNKLDASSSREFEMPADRLALQENKITSLRLAASQRYWEQQGGWDQEDREYAGKVGCRRGAWYIRLTHEPLHADLRFRDAVYDEEHAKPQQFDFCFGVPLKAGDKPPDLMVHVASNLLSTKAAAAVAAAGREEEQLQMSFVSVPDSNNEKKLGWLLERGCLRRLLNVLATPAAPPEVLCFKLRPGSASESGMVHVDFERNLMSFPALQPAASRASEAKTAGLAAGSAGTAGTASGPAAGLSACAAATDAAQAAGTPRAAASTGAAGSADQLATATSLTGLALLAATAGGPAAATAAVPAVKSPQRQPAKRSQSGGTSRAGKRPKTGSKSGDKQEARARLTVGGQAYFAGSFPTERAAEYAKDLLNIWVHFYPQCFPAGWMQACETIQPPLKYTVAEHLATHAQLVADLSGCNDVQDVRALLRKHLKGAPSSLADEQLPLFITQQWEAPIAGEQRPTGSTAAGSSISAKQFGVAAAGEPAPDGSAAWQQAGPQPPQPQPSQQPLFGLEQLFRLEPAGLAPAEPEASQEDAVEQLQASLQLPAQQAAQAPQQAHQQATDMTVVLPQPLPALPAGGQPLPPPQSLPALLVGGQPPPHQQQQQPEAVVAAAAGEQQLQPAPMVAPLPAGSVSGRSGAAAGDSWSADIRQQAVEALTAAGADKQTDEQCAVAQLDAVLAALKLLGGSTSAQLACCKHFPLLRAGQRYGLLAGLRVVAAAGSGADLLAWVNDVGLSSSQQ